MSVSLHILMASASNSPVKAVRSSSDVPTRLSPLHVAVWVGDLDLVKEIVKAAPQCIDDKLKSFGSPLQLALALGERDIAEHLLSHGANLLQRDAATRKTIAYILPLAMHDMDFVHSAYKNLDSQLDDARLRRLPRLSAALTSIPDFECTIQFKFESWIPLAGLMLPTDVLTIRKHGSNVRVDGTIVGFKNLKWQRGNVSFIFRGSAEHEYDCALHVADHVKHTHADLYFLVASYRRFDALRRERAAAIAAGDAKEPLTVEEAAQLLGLTPERAAVLKQVDEEQQEGVADSVDSRLGRSMPVVDWWSRDVAFERDVSWWGKKPVSDTVAGHECAVYNMKNLIVKADASPAIWPERLKALEQRMAEADAARGRQPSQGKSLKESLKELGGVLGLGGAAQGSLSQRTSALDEQFTASLGAVRRGEDADIIAQSAAASAAELAEHAKGGDEQLLAPAKPAADGAAAAGAASGAASAASGDTALEDIAQGAHAAAADRAFLLHTLRELAAEKWDIRSAAADGSAGSVSTVWHQRASDKVPSGAYTVVLVPLPAGAALQWSVTVPAHDITVVSLFVPAAESVAAALNAAAPDVAQEEAGGEVPMTAAAVPAQLVAPRTLSEHTKTQGANGSASAVVSGTFALLLSNKHAYWHSKDPSIHFEMTVPVPRRMAEALVEEGPLKAVADGVKGGSAAVAKTNKGGSMAGSHEGQAVEGPFAVPPGCKWVKRSFHDVFAAGPATVLAEPATGMPGDPSSEELPSSWQECNIVDAVQRAADAAQTGDGGAAPVAGSIPAHRPMIVPRAPKTSDKNISAKVKMTQTFPIPVSYLLPVAEAVARTSSHMENFSRFLHTKLPQGFPVAFELPIVPTVTAKVQFLSAKVAEQDPELFRVPSQYRDCTSEVMHGTYFTNLGRIGEHEAAAASAAAGDSADGDAPAAAAPSEASSEDAATAQAAAGDGK